MQTNLIIIPFGQLWSWTADYEKQTALLLSKQNIVIAFLIGEGYSVRQLFGKREALLSEQHPNLFIFRPVYVLPFQRFSRIKAVNLRLAALQLKFLIRIRKDWNRRTKILWSFSSQHACPPAIFTPEYRAVYDCVDDVASYDRRLNGQWATDEHRLVKHADVVFANTDTLYRIASKLHPKVFRVPIGFDKRVFTEAGKPVVPDDLAAIPTPRITFIGNINSRLDFNLLNGLIRQTPAYSYVFIGKIDPDFSEHRKTFGPNLNRLRRYENVYFLGTKSRKQIVSYIQSSDIGLIPYDVSIRFNQNCFPMKLLEFFYTGVPVVSTAIREVANLSPLIRIAENADDAARAIASLLASDTDNTTRNKQRQFAQQNSWEHKVRQMHRILKSELGILIWS